MQWEWQIALHFEFEEYLASIPAAIEKVVYICMCIYVYLHMDMYVCVAVVHVMEHAS